MRICAPISAPSGRLAHRRHRNRREDCASFPRIRDAKSVPTGRFAYRVQCGRLYSRSAFGAAGWIYEKAASQYRGFTNRFPYYNRADLRSDLIASWRICESASANRSDLRAESGIIIVWVFGAISSRSGGFTRRLPPPTASLSRALMRRSSSVLSFFSDRLSNIADRRLLSRKITDGASESRKCEAATRPRRSYCPGNPRAARIMSVQSRRCGAECIGYSNRPKTNEGRN